MAVTDKKTGVWGLDQTYNKINQGSIWEFSQSGELFSWGKNNGGQLAKNNTTYYSSPVQIPGTTWSITEGNSNTGRKGDGSGGSGRFIKNDGTLWSWGYNTKGQLGQNDLTYYSSPIQIGSGTDWKAVSGASPNNFTSGAIKTDGTLWVWGRNDEAQLGQSSLTQRSSPVQLPGTNWSSVLAGAEACAGIKTDGTLWTWGRNHHGQLGHNNLTNYSSPKQIPGTTWIEIAGGYRQLVGLKSAGTMWSWGDNYHGALGVNLPPSSHPSYSNSMSSPVQIPGTNWRSIKSGNFWFSATKTDGTLWTWGTGSDGQLGHNEAENKSAPIQIPGTTWNIHDANGDMMAAIKNDGTMWMWGGNPRGQLGQNDRTQYSSPAQIPGTWMNTVAGNQMFFGSPS